MSRSSAKDPDVLRNDICWMTEAQWPYHKDLMWRSDSWLSDTVPGALVNKHWPCMSHALLTDITQKSPVCQEKNNKDNHSFKCLLASAQCYAGMHASKAIIKLLMQFGGPMFKATPNDCATQKRICITQSKSARTQCTLDAGPLRQGHKSESQH